MSERPTPETDAQPKSIEFGAGETYHTVSADFARRLERERDEARAKCETTHLLAEALAKTQVELKAERDEAREALFGMNWVSVERELPPMDVPVWLYLTDIRMPVIGCRSDGGEGWIWCRCYDDFWFDGAWKTSTADADDDKPSHWMPLPLPPNASLERAERSDDTLEDLVRCENCGGSGVISFNPNLNPNSLPGTATAKCTRCGGTGIEDTANNVLNNNKEAAK